jgi:hypothetical protein
MIVFAVIVIAILVFVLFRVLFAPRPPMIGPANPYVQQVPGPVYVEPDPIADIATVFAAEAIVDTAVGAFDAFDSGPADFGGGDPGFGSGFGGDGF